MGGNAVAMALEGIKVIDVSQVAAVPMAARHLADFGADVVHIENPASGDSWRYFQAGQGPGNNGVPSDFNYNWENFNRNKRSATLDLSKQEGQSVIRKMAAQADVFLTNLRPFERERFNLTYETLKGINPRIIYASITGFGKKGPDKDAPAYDITAYWTRSGFSNILTIPGLSPPGFRAAMGDNVAALALAYGIMMALYVREKTGVGQEIDTALMQIGLYQISFDIAGALVTGLDYKDWRPEPPPELVAKAQQATAPITAFHRSQVMNPLATVYVTKDDMRILLMMLQPDRYWALVCQAIGKPELGDDPRFNNFEGRAKNRELVFEILDRTFATKTLAEWKSILKDIPYAPQRTIKEAIDDPQSEANNFFVGYEHPAYGNIRMVANPVNMSETPFTVRMPAPELGQHTEEVLLEYGYTWEDIAGLKERGVIG